MAVFCVQDWYNALLHNVDGEESSVWLTAALPENGVAASARRLLARYHNDALAEFMNGSVRKHVGFIPGNVSWGGQSAKVSSFCATCFHAHTWKGEHALRMTACLNAPMQGPAVSHWHKAMAGANPRFEGAGQTSTIAVPAVLAVFSSGLSPSLCAIAGF